MSSKVYCAQSRRSRENVIAAPRETLVTSVGGFRIPHRLLSSSPYPLFRISVIPQLVGHVTELLQRRARWRFGWSRLLSSIESGATVLACLRWLRRTPS